jgi:DNA-binding Xre family transcriptional regulator
MIKYNLKKLIAEKEFEEDRRITYDEIAAETGISRTTLSLIATKRGYDTGVSNVEKLCIYFGCAVSDFIDIVQESKKPMAKKRKSK